MPKSQISWLNQKKTSITESAFCSPSEFNRELKVEEQQDKPHISILVSPKMLLKAMKSE